MSQCTDLSISDLGDLYWRPMAYDNLRAVLRSGRDLRSRFLLGLAVAATSHPRLRSVVLPILRVFSARGAVAVSYLEPTLSVPLSASLRLSDLRSDLQTFLELGTRDCYRVPASFTPSVVIDGGANIGLFTLSMARRFPDAVLVAFEPLQENINVCKKHFAENSVRVRVENFCLGARQATGKFVRRDANRGSLSDTGEGMEVNVVPLSEFVPNSPTLVKLDIEGAEVAVIESFLNAPRPNVFIVGELHHWPENESVFLKILERSDWTASFFERDAVCVLFHAYPRAFQKTACA